MPNLTEKQRKFVEAYMGKAKGNATEAVRLAGYSHKYADRQAHQLLENDRVLGAIEERQKNDPLIASREDRQRFWTDVMNGENHEIKDRLRASEILGKSQADFIERREVSGPNGGPIPFKSVNTDPYDGD